MNGVNTGINSWLSNTALAQKRQNLPPLKPEQPNPADANSTKAVDKVSFSQKWQNLVNAKDNPLAGKFLEVGSDEHAMGHGLMAASKERLREWQKRGFIITEQSIRAIDDVMTKIHIEAAQNTDNHLHSMSINFLQIIQDNQPTPDWFKQEKINLINQSDHTPEDKQALLNGEYVLHYFRNPDTQENKTETLKKDALAAYRLHNRKNVKEDEQMENNKRFKQLKEALEHRSINKKEQTDMGAAKAEKIDKSYAEKYPDAPNNRVVEGTTINRPPKV